MDMDMETLNNIHQEWLRSQITDSDSFMEQPELLDIMPDYSDIGIMSKAPSRWWRRSNTYNVVWETDVEWVPRDSDPIRHHLKSVVR